MNENKPKLRFLSNNFIKQVVFIHLNAPHLPFFKKVADPPPPPPSHHPDP